MLCHVLCCRFTKLIYPFRSTYEGYKRPKAQAAPREDQNRLAQTKMQAQHMGRRD